MVKMQNPVDVNEPSEHEPDALILRMVDPVDDAIDNLIEEQQFGATAGLLMLLSEDDTEECQSNDDIQMYVRGELSKPDSFLLEEHIKVCTTCRKAVETAQREKNKTSE